MLRFVGLLSLPFLIAAILDLHSVSQIENVAHTLSAVPAASAQVSDSPVAPFLHPIIQVRESTNLETSDARLFIENQSDPNIIVSFDLGYVDDHAAIHEISSGDLPSRLASTDAYDDPNLAGDEGRYALDVHFDNCEACPDLLQPLTLHNGKNTIVLISFVTLH